ncbi:flavodoxin family protein [Frisingicoccus sp.]|uniref:flavodoxin family protein n=1 Tax=Frisingicoccus sp. TaxID=1918627 RepID=UPI002A83FC6C|nr:flavodoxin [Frisingicoccus sp.]MDY4923019.1 flavodoxin [Frisingicoccus sp.]
MKTAIVYYSMTGNAKYVAGKIAEKIDSDIIRIEPVKAYPDKGAKKFIWGEKSAVMGENPALQPYEFSVEKYDRIILGTPVWAGTFAPPIRTFIKENPNIQGKRTAVFTCFSGGGADKAIEKMKKYIGIEEFEAELMLLTESTGWMIRIIPAEIWIQQRLM